MINQASALLALSRMMGKRILPSGDNLDWKDYVQTAFDYAWRYYQWDWSMRTVSVDMTTPHMPTDFDIGGYILSVDGYERRTPVDYALNTSETNTFSLEWDSTNGWYTINTRSDSPTLTFVYQIAPPTLGTDSVPFPSAMTIGIGASIYAKMGENPTRADITQEWDVFHDELDRHVGRIDSVAPLNTNRNLQDSHDTYTGDVR